MRATTDTGGHQWLCGVRVPGHQGNGGQEREKERTGWGGEGLGLRTETRLTRLLSVALEHTLWEAAWPEVPWRWGVLGDPSALAQTCSSLPNVCMGKLGSIREHPLEAGPAPGESSSPLC